MKLRIRGNSIRLRLSRAEVAQMTSAGTVVDRIDFGTSQLEYRVSGDSAADRPSARFDGAAVDVRLPEAAVARWAGSDAEVSIEGTQAIDGDAEGLRILVEKDFACLKPREGEDDSDMFAHPEAGQLQC
jgi:hypothetical protein